MPVINKHQIRIREYLFLSVLDHVSILNLKVRIYRQHFKITTVEKEQKQDREMELRENKGEAESAPDESNKGKTCIHIIKDKANAGHTIRRPSSTTKVLILPSERDCREETFIYETVLLLFRFFNTQYMKSL